MGYTVAGSVTRANSNANNPGWFWAAGTDTARPVCVGRGSGGFFVTETSMPYPTDVRPVTMAGGAR